MKAPFLLASFLVAGATAAGVSWLLAPPPVAAGAGTEGEVRALAQRVEELARRVEEVASRPAAAAAAPIAREAVPGLDPAAIDQAVRAWLADHRAEPAVIAAAGTAGAAPDAVAFDPAATAAELAKLDWDTTAQRWQKLSKEQRTALLAHFEGLAKAQPNNADTQVRLGEAYVQMLMAPGTGFLEMGKWGQLADRQFTKALELDDHHWNARFNKAMGLAHQPAILGSRPKAIEHFEVLIGQQEKLAPEARHADVYLVLGNLLAEQGDRDKARAMWERGRKRHPGSRALADKLKE